MNDPENITSPSEDTPRSDFIRDIVTHDVATGKNDAKVVTRFPPEPNGYLHIGHAKSICLNFGIASEYPGGVCHLRFDDTNPARESVEFVESIKDDVRWLGFDWGDRLHFASDYFEQLYQFAVQLITDGKAYVCDLTADEIRQFRGTPIEPGKDSPYRTRAVGQNLDLFGRMRAGEFADGSRVLRAKIDMASPNLHMRDPALYRIRRAHHHRTGDQWCVYPMYDFTHCISDAIEGVTHSLCTLEFEVHRPLYDWVLDQLPVACHPRQIEFARLNLNFSVLSKRRLLELVTEGHVEGWSDPRMPTISGLRRRGYTPESIRSFCERIGLTKYDGITDIALLEFSIRQGLNKIAPRRLAVLRPLRVVIENFPEGQTEELDAVNNPEDPSAGSRKIPFSRVIYIEQDDFMEEPAPKYFRLSPGREVRLRFAYIMKCVDVVKDPESGSIVEVRCTIDPESRSGGATAGRRVKGTIHWVSAAHSIEADVRLYDRLFTVENPVADKARDYREFLNPASLETLRGCRLEPSLGSANKGDRFQFERLGYFCVDSADSLPDRPVLNRTVTLRDAWARLEKSKKP